MAVTPEQYLHAADTLLGAIERGAYANEREAEVVRQDLNAAARGDAARAVERSQPVRSARVAALAPTTQTRAQISAATESTRQRFTEFRLRYLDRAAVERLRQGSPEALPGDVRSFVRYSRRLAREVRAFLREIGEEEPSLQEEVEETLEQVEDAKNDLVKLEVRQWTRVSESLLRSAGGGWTREQASRAIDHVNLDRNLWNLSVLEHPRAVVRGLLANAADRMARRGRVMGAEVRPLAFVGLGPDAAAQATPGTRAGELLWRAFTPEQLTELYSQREKPTSHRGLGLSYNTREQYVPIPPAVRPAVLKELEVRRAAFLGGRAGSKEPAVKHRSITGRAVLDRLTVDELRHLAWSRQIDPGDLRKRELVEHLLERGVAP